MRNRWEALNNGWNQWVLGYNPERQRELMFRLGVKEADWRSMTAALAGLCGATLLIISLWILYQRNSADPAKRAWQRYCAAIKRCGIMRSEWEGPCDFAVRVAHEREDLAALTNEAAHLYADLRYGQGGKEQLRRLHECTRRLPARWRRKP
jgi:hypothetical protein